jgi:hypothetical protein
MEDRPRISSGSSGNFLALLCMAFLFAVNAYICGDLFGTEITRQTGAIDAAFISFSRWLVDHWSDKSWLPMWVTGTPVRQVYQPVLHFSVAELARLTRWTPPHAYHFVTATAYCLGPVTLFWLCYRATRRHGFAMLAGTIYSLLSPSALFFETVRLDGGLWHARRFQALVQYGEGPHITAMMMIPIVIWLLDEASTARRWIFLPLAPVGLATLVLTNWTGTTGLTMALIAYGLSRLGATDAEQQRPLHWPTLLGIGAIAYLIASPWIPPSLVQAVRVSSANLQNPIPVTRKLLVLVPLALVLAGLHFVFQRTAVNRWFRFFLYFSLVSGIIAGSDLGFDWRVIPIAQRFHLEMEMAVAGAVAYAALAVAARLPSWLRFSAAYLVILLFAAQVRHYRNYARDLARPIDFTTTVEYKFSQWFAAHMDGRRVFAPGTTSIWMNLYSDVPQVFGCCDQSVRDDEHRIANYMIYTGEGAGERDGEIAILWLKAYGAAAVAVAATGSSQLGQPYANPHKFDGLLPELWRDGESVIYEIPQPSHSLAHVVNRAAVLERAPVNGIDVEPLLPLIHALDDPSVPPATFRWLNQHEAEITAQTEPSQVLFIQETYDPGWHASEAGAEIRIAREPLGLMTMDPGRAGLHTIRLIYSGSLEDRLARIAQLGGLVLLAAWTVLAWRRSRRSLTSLTS